MLLTNVGRLAISNCFPLIDFKDFQEEVKMPFKDGKGHAEGRGQETT